jgi:hypothetical protein
MLNTEKYMKRFIFTAGLFTTLAFYPLLAQSQDLSANIPFNFQMGQAVLPAGKYMVHESNGLVVLREQTGKGAAMRLTLPTSRSNISSDPALEFTRYGDEYHLTNIWNGSSNTGRALIQSKREKELASRFKTVETAGVILNTK